MESELKSVALACDDKQGATNYGGPRLDWLSGQSDLANSAADHLGTLIEALDGIEAAIRDLRSC